MAPTGSSPVGGRTPPDDSSSGTADDSGGGTAGLDVSDVIESATDAADRAAERATETARETAPSGGNGGQSDDGSLADAASDVVDRGTSTAGGAASRAAGTATATPQAPVERQAAAARQVGETTTRATDGAVQTARGTVRTAERQAGVGGDILSDPTNARTSPVGGSGGQVRGGQRGARGFSGDPDPQGGIGEDVPTSARGQARSLQSEAAGQVRGAVGPEDIFVYYDEETGRLETRLTASGRREIAARDLGVDFSDVSVSSVPVGPGTSPVGGQTPPEGTTGGQRFDVDLSDQARVSLTAERTEYAPDELTVRDGQVQLTTEARRGRRRELAADELGVSETDVQLVPPGPGTSPVGGQAPPESARREVRLTDEGFQEYVAESGPESDEIAGIGTVEVQQAPSGLRTYTVDDPTRGGGPLSEVTAEGSLTGGLLEEAGERFEPVAEAGAQLSVYPSETIAQGAERAGVPGASRVEEGLESLETGATGAFNIPRAAQDIQTAGEVGSYVLGAEGTPDDAFERIQTVGEAGAEAGGQAVQYARENPLQTTGAVAGGAVLGTAAAGGARAGVSAARSGVRRARGASGGSRTVGGTDIRGDAPDPWGEIDPSRTLREQAGPQQPGPVRQAASDVRDIWRSERGQAQIPRGRQRQRGGGGRDRGGTSESVRQDALTQYQDYFDDLRARERAATGRSIDPDTDPLGGSRSRATFDPSAEQTPPRGRSTTDTDIETTPRVRDPSREAAGILAAAQRPEVTVGDTVDGREEALELREESLASLAREEEVIGDVAQRQDLAMRAEVMQETDGLEKSGQEGDMLGMGPDESLASGEREDVQSRTGQDVAQRPAPMTDTGETTRDPIPPFTPTITSDVPGTPSRPPGTTGGTPWIRIPETDRSPVRSTTPTDGTGLFTSESSTSDLQPGWFAETVTVAATRGMEAPRAPAQSELEDVFAGVRGAQDLPTAQLLESDEGIGGTADLFSFGSVTGEEGFADGDWLDVGDGDGEGWF